MLKYIFTTMFLLLNLIGFCQTYFPLIKQEKIQTYVNIEKNINSEPLINRGKYVTPSSLILAQPTIFIRKNTGFHPAPVVKYFFSLPDSIVKQIDIEIDSLNYLPQTYEAMTNYSEPQNRLKAFEKQYNIIYDELCLNFGKPNESKPIKKEKYGLESFAWKKGDKWENDSLTIDMYLVFADKKKTGGEYKIRVYINFKDKKQTAQFEFNPKQDSIAQAFINLIFVEKYLESWNLLIEDLRKTMKYEDYVKGATELKRLYFDNYKVILVESGAGLFDALPFYTYKIASESKIPENGLMILFSDKKSLQILFFKLKTF